MKTCFLCGGEIHGRSVEIWAQHTSAPFAPSDAPIAWHEAHPDCAAMLEETDDEEEDTDGRQESHD